MVREVANHAVLGVAGHKSAVAGEDETPPVGSSPAGPRTVLGQQDPLGRVELIVEMDRVVNHAGGGPAMSGVLVEAGMGTERSRDEEPAGHGTQERLIHHVYVVGRRLTRP